MSETIPWACDVCGEPGTKCVGPEGYCDQHRPKPEPMVPLSVLRELHADLCVEAERCASSRDACYSRDDRDGGLSMHVQWRAWHNAAGRCRALIARYKEADHG